MLPRLPEWAGPDTIDEFLFKDWDRGYHERRFSQHRPCNKSSEVFTSFPSLAKISFLSCRICGPIVALPNTDILSVGLNQELSYPVTNYEECHFMF